MIIFHREKIGKRGIFWYDAINEKDILWTGLGFEWWGKFLCGAVYQINSFVSNMTRNLLIRLFSSKSRLKRIS